MEFKEEIKKIEEVANSLSEKEPEIQDLTKNQKINQIRAHLHSADILLKQM